VNPLAGDQLLGHAHCVARRAAIVAHHQLELASVDAAGRIDFLQGELHALFVGLEKGSEHLVAVELADFDRLGKNRGGDQRQP
jgi:hypothetical protein